MDKATLLAEAITQIKQLRKTASQASEGLHIPMDSDEVKVETLENKTVDGSFLLRASLCCEHWQDLLSDLRQVMRNLKVRILKSEISTLGSRVKVAFLIETAEGDSASRVYEAMSKVVEKVSALAESAEQLFIPRKRQRVSCIDSSSYFFAWEFRKMPDKVVDELNVFWVLCCVDFHGLCLNVEKIIIDLFSSTLKQSLVANEQISKLMPGGLVKLK